MKWNKPLIWSLGLLVLVAALYRIIPGRPPGFAPQLAMAVFAGAIIKNKKWAFLMPVLSIFISDLLYQVLFQAGVSSRPGFYEGQWQNYLLFGLLVVVGFAIKKASVLNVLVCSLIAPTVYFILSNLVLWAGWTGTRGLGRPKTWSGLLMCYNDALPFYVNSLYATVVFSVVLFGSYYLLRKNSAQSVASIL
jgi:hypothetical protein